jgi:hypothetical protein
MLQESIKVSLITVSVEQLIYLKKNPWLLGKMLESGFPDASGREEG